MNYQKAAVAPVLMFLFAASHAGEPRYACDFKRPPYNSKVISTPHGLSWQVYPPIIPAHYTGCRVVWMRGYKLAEVRIKRGKVMSAEIRNPGEEVKQCAYDGSGALRSGEPGACGTADQWLSL